MAWDVVIGLEIHAQLATKSKIFSGSSTAYGQQPNTQACEVDLGMPGVLPVLNRQVLKKAVLFGLAVDAKIAKRSIFARKNYFYPDLPKGYQISQMDAPIVGKGSLQIELKDGSSKTIGITRAHLEEDAGKSIHDAIPNATGIDLNRAGVPLLEIVSEPEIENAEQAVAYMRTIHSLVQFIGICDGNMQEGSFRCDVNISLRKSASEPFGTRVEIKNLNSFRFVEQAIEYEINRQAEILESGEKVEQETRLYNADIGATRAMRSKEDANDYRYFPDPDLLPVVIDDAYIEAIRQQMPELPQQKQQRYQKQFALSAYDSALLSHNKPTADYFEAIIAAGGEPKLAANWVNGELAAALNKSDCSIENSPVSADQLAGVLQRISDKTISGTIGKQVFETMWQQGGSADAIIKAQGLQQISDPSAIVAIIDAVIANNEAQVANYRQAEEQKRGKMIGFFVGQVMKETKGKANPQQVNRLLKQQLDK